MSEPAYPKTEFSLPKEGATTAKMSFVVHAEVELTGASLPDWRLRDQQKRNAPLKPQTWAEYNLFLRECLTAVGEIAGRPVYALEDIERLRIIPPDRQNERE